MIAVSIFFLLIFSLIIFPNYRSIKKINQQIADLRSNLEIKYERAKHLHQSQVHLADVQKITKEWNKKFLKKGDEIKLITSLENLAEELNLQQTLSLGSVYQPLKNGFLSLDLNSTISGEYKNILRYIDTLQNQVSSLAINEISASQGGPASVLERKKIKNPVTSSLKMNLYVQE